MTTLTEADHSKNATAKKVMGLRPTGLQPLDDPCELGYHCPVCQYELLVDGHYDYRLEWSEYNAMLWCSVCNRAYPSCLCMPEFSHAIEIFLSTVSDALQRQEPKAPFRAGSGVIDRRSETE